MPAKQGLRRARAPLTLPTNAYFYVYGNACKHTQLLCRRSLIHKILKLSYQPYKVVSTYKNFMKTQEKTQGISQHMDASCISQHALQYCLIPCSARTASLDWKTFRAKRSRLAQLSSLSDPRASPRSHRITESQNPSPASPAAQSGRLRAGLHSAEPAERDSHALPERARSCPVTVAIFPDRVTTVGKKVTSSPAICSASTAKQSAGRRAEGRFPTEGSGRSSSAGLT